MSMKPVITGPSRQTRRRLSWARRGVLENVAIALILLGVFMLVQPFSITLYGWSFLTVLVGIVMFTVVSKLPE